MCTYVRMARKRTNHDRIKLYYTNASCYVYMMNRCDGIVIRGSNQTQIIGNDLWVVTIIRLVIIMPILIV